MQTKTIREATKLWRYMSSFAQERQSDAVVVCCSYDLRVCDYACGLIKKGHASTLVLSGNQGNWTRHLYTKPEAQIFNDRAIANGISSDNILTEQSSTNFGENIRFSTALLPNAKTITFVSKPNSLLRIKLTAEAQAPKIIPYAACPPLAFPQEVSNTIGLFGIINEMVGDIERILTYPELGFQTPHNLPAEIIDAYEYLIAEGFTYHLINP